MTHALCSAVALNYNPGACAEEWAPLASLILEAAYEATLYVALEASRRHSDSPGAKVVLLTLVGGGVFGNRCPPLARLSAILFLFFENVREYGVVFFVLKLAPFISKVFPFRALTGTSFLLLFLDPGIPLNMTRMRIPEYLQQP